MSEHPSTPTTAAPATGLEQVSLGARVRQLADERPDTVAVTFVAKGRPDQELTYAELERRSNQVAVLLREHGVDVGDRVAVGLRNSPEHIVAALGAWKLGAGIVTLRWDVPAWERDRLLDVTHPRLMLAEADGAAEGVPVLAISRADAFEDERVAISVPERPMAIPTGGSTGASKAVLLPVPGAMPVGATFQSNYNTFGIEPIERHLVMGPMYHSNPLLMVHAALFEAQHLILLEKFDGALMLDVLARLKPDFLTLVPTMMRRLLDTPGIEDADWSSLKMILHGTAPTPAWLKRRWIDLVGGELLWEVFASSELVGSTVVRGDEWLERPGTVGRPAPGTELRILDDEQRPVPDGEVGEIYMRIVGTTAPAFDYLGADRPKTTPDGFTSVGDLGRLDADGYLFPADRKGDLIITGGANVVPAEVEAALGEHPEVVDVAVIGLPDDDWGQRVHAVVQPRDLASPPDAGELEAFGKARLTSYKVPKTFEFVAEMPRSEMFKIRRSALAAERS